MKKCPYCAEQIQDEAVICRYCNRRVKADVLGILVRAVIVISLAALIGTHWKQVSIGYHKAKRAVKRFYSDCTTFLNAVQQFPESVKAMHEHKTGVMSLMQDATKNASAEAGNGWQDPHD